MSGPGASSDVMPGFSLPSRELDEPLLDMLLNGRPLPADAPEQLHAVAGLFASLAGPAGPGKLTGEAAARSAYARAAAPVGVSPVARRPARRRLPWLPARVNARLAAGLAAAAVCLSSAAGAYAAVLPGPIQDFAHHVIGAPAARHAPPRVPSGRQAANRLCSTYEHAMTHGPARAKAVASQKLARAAGGAGEIDAYCAAAWRPSLAPAAPAAHPASHPKPRPKTGNAKAAKRKAHGKPKAHPSRVPTARRRAHGKAKSQSGSPVAHDRG
jgi:hypothetical protein